MIYICPKCGEENSQGHECTGESEAVVQAPCSGCVSWKLAYEQLLSKYNQLLMVQATQQPFTITTSTTPTGIYSGAAAQPWVYVNPPSNGSGT